MAKRKKVVRKSKGKGAKAKKKIVRRKSSASPARQAKKKGKTSVSAGQAQKKAKTKKSTKASKTKTAKKKASTRTATTKAKKTTKAAKATKSTKAAKTTKSKKRATKKAEPEVVEEVEEPRERTLEEIPTEELWTLYREQASKTGAQEAEKLDLLRNTLIERHYPLVRYIAERLLQTLPKSIELDDLVSAGLFGLMDAIRGFDASRGIKFKTYCSTRIRGAILDQLRSQDWVPRLVRLKASRIERALQRLTAEYGREPTHSELAKVLEMDHQDLVKEIQEARAKTMFSLSEKWEDEDGSVEKVEVLEDKTATDPVTEMNRRDLMGFITRALTHKERFIIEQYYQYGHTMREIGEMLALTESRVCQIHSNVMSRLKGLLGQKQGNLLS